MWLTSRMIPNEKGGVRWSLMAVTMLSWRWWGVLDVFSLSSFLLLFLFVFCFVFFFFFFFFIFFLFHLWNFLVENEQIYDKKKTYLFFFHPIWDLIVLGWFLSLFLLLFSSLSPPPPSYSLAYSQLKLFFPSLSS